MSDDREIIVGANNYYYFWKPGLRTYWNRPSVKLRGACEISNDLLFAVHAFITAIDEHGARWNGSQLLTTRHGIVMHIGRDERWGGRMMTTITMYKGQ